MNDSNIKLGPFVSHLPSLSDEQLAGLGAGNTSILACPGSGKTHTVTFRYMCREERDPRGKALITFTRAAADEARTRCRHHPQLLNAPNYIGTFDAFLRHSLVVPTWLEAHDSEPLLVDDWNLVRDNRTLVKLRLKDSGIPLDRFQFAVEKNQVIVSSVMPKDIRESRQLQNAYQSQEMDNLYGRAVSNLLGLMKDGALSADSLRIFCLLRIGSTQFEARLRHLVRRFSELIIDEAQDMSSNDWTILDKLTELGLPLAIVGDPNQSIYGFRGVKHSDFVSRAQRMSVRCSFTNNRRSSQTICDFAQCLVADAGGPIPIMTGREDEIDTIYIIDPRSQNPVKRFGALLKEQGLDAIDTTVLARNWSLAAELAGDNAYAENAGETGFLLPSLIHNGRLASSDGSPHRVRVKARDNLRMLIFGTIDRSDSTGFRSLDSLLRSLNVETRKIESLVSRVILAANQPDSETVLRMSYAGMLSEVFPDRVINQRSISGRLRFASKMSTSTPHDGESVTFPYSTIHSAKGKEWESVLLSLATTRKDESDWIGRLLTNERSEISRVFYVGATRAKRLLCLTLGVDQLEDLEKLLRLSNVRFEILGS